MKMNNADIMTGICSKKGLPTPGGEFFGCYNCGENVYEDIFTGATRTDYFDYKKALENAGAELFDENNIEDNLHTFYKFADAMVCVYFIPSEAKLRIIYDNFTSFVPLEKNTAGKCCVRMWQFEIDHRLIDCGMCYIFQCSDYSFFVIDSAHPYSVADDIRIYDFMRSKTPPGLPVVVSGWFFSHGHADHIGKFIDIFKYNRDIIIEGIYFNFVPDSHFSSDSWDVSDKAFTREFIDLVTKQDKIPVYKLHCGQRFFVKDLFIEVLCTHEDVFPESLDDYNNSSTVIMISVGDDRISFPGDAAGKENEILLRRYNDTLKCDIVQVAHHGHFGTSPEYYIRSDAKVALFATTHIKYDEEFPRYEANRTAVRLADHVFISSDGTVGFTFPLKDSDVVIYPDEIIEDFDGVYALWGYEYTEEYKNKLREQKSSRSEIRKIGY